jgi:ADP-ribose pyrophosphatase YjhB (NUDIX family)
MRIYIKDIPLRIKQPDAVGDLNNYDAVVETDDFLINEKVLKGNVLILNANRGMIKAILFILHNQGKKLKTLSSVTISTDYYDDAVEYIKSKFKIIKAGGGVVYKDGKVLMIHRLGMWDLPKGKVEKKESVSIGAVREVEEECNIKVALRDKICTTWHTYTTKEQSILKKTVWFHMDCLDDSKMKPQLDEGIDEVKWMNKKELDVALYNAFRSIQHVYKKFKKKLAAKPQSV